MSSVAIPENTDYPTLNLGYNETSCQTVNIVGLDVKVYGLEEVQSSSLPLAAVVSVSFDPPSYVLALPDDVARTMPNDAHLRSRHMGDATTKNRCGTSPMVCLDMYPLCLAISRERGT